MAHGVSSPAPGRGRLATLVGLHLILTWRPVRAEKTAGIIGTAVLILAMSVLGIVLGATSFGLTMALQQRADGPILILWAGSAALFVALLLQGLFREGVGGGIDVSPLFHMPVAPGEMVRAGLLSRLLGPWTLPPAGFFTGCVAAAALSGRVGFALAVIPAALLWCVHAFLILMAGDFLLFNLRRSRRVVEALGILGTLLLMTWMVVMNRHALGHQEGDASMSMGGLTTLWRALGPALMVLPGFSAASWVGAGWLAAVRLPVALAEAAGLYWLAGVLLGRLVDQGAAEGRGRKRRTEAAPVPSRAGLLDRWAVWPLARKDFLYFARDPFLKTMLMGMVLAPMVMMLIFMGQNSPFGMTFVHFGIPLFILMSFARVSTNLLGLERTGLMVLLGSPVPRWKVLLGKNLVVLALFAAVLAVPTGILLWKGSPAGLVAADVAMALSAALIFFGAGNFMSIYMPLPMAPKGRRLAAQVPVGRQFLAMFVQMALTGACSLASLPIVIGRVAAGALGASALWVALLGAAMLLYGTVIYAVLLACASRLMPPKEPDIYEALVRTQT